MAEQLPDSVRVMICKMYAEDNKRCVDIAKELGIRYRTVVSVVALHRRTRRVVCVRRGPKRGIVDEEMMDFVRAMFYEGGSLRGMQACVLAEYGRRVSVTTLQRATRCIWSKGRAECGSVEPGVIESVEPGVIGSVEPGVADHVGLLIDWDCYSFDVDRMVDLFWDDLLVNKRL
jgi:hypothetical protein